ncbi:hypothetical protein CHLRE_17g700425v5 [Chlamydomonas reinhardtii]|uniref:Uncharacterized protein n=1 Tax=Chlamydomonas reinhardtii TaxID=3055 RepID=A0A2K3CNX0_CHLRE|nr:uncharacterized protein CHLRE_17g700425v5 [Chlamydomonas reinhardtii]PNW69974.1 hypothetical protein CHLRE_17g700425v5 [Chlamydomonas reinhardtii]
MAITPASPLHCGSHQGSVGMVCETFRRMTALGQTYTHADWQYAYGTPCTGPDVADERRIDIAPHAGGGVAVRHTKRSLSYHRARQLS